MNLRYEVIYKNLLRDLRKFYVADFYESTDYIKLKKNQDSRFYINCVRSYVIDK